METMCAMCEQKPGKRRCLLEGQKVCLECCTQVINKYLCKDCRYYSIEAEQAAPEGGFRTSVKMLEQEFMNWKEKGLGVQLEKEIEITRTKAIEQKEKKKKKRKT